MKEELTEVQSETLSYLKWFMSAFDRSPTVRELMTALRLRSPAPVQSRLNHLRKKGYVDWIDGQPRTIRIVNPGVRRMDIPLALVPQVEALIEQYVPTPVSPHGSEAYQMVQKMAGEVE